jgi:hypothetical protein
MTDDAEKPQAPPAPNPLHVGIVKNVRIRSQRDQRPVKMEIIGEDGQAQGPEFTLSVLTTIEANPACVDIRHFSLPNGEIYAYSERFITDAYATLWARIQTGDQVSLVAETVRMESATYPRATPAKVFLDTPYDLSEDELQAVLRELPNLPQFADILSVTASTKQVYLYSDRFITEPQARSMAEWEEVGRFQNP